MRFLQSPAHIAQELQQRTDQATEKVKTIKEEQAVRFSAFNKEVERLRESLEAVLNGSTPSDAVDIKALRAFLKKNSGSDLQAVAKPA